MLIAIAALTGLLVGGVINSLADFLPTREGPIRPHCSQCKQLHPIGKWLAIGQLTYGGTCGQCGLRTRRRAIITEIGMAILLIVMAVFISPLVDFIIYGAYAAILVLISIVDWEHRKIPNAVTFPATIMALAASPLLMSNSLPRSLAGGFIGFLLLYVAYYAGRRLLGPGTLGFGDVTLAMCLGAMVGYPSIIHGLLLGFLLLGIWIAFAVVRSRISRGSMVAYGPFFSAAGIMIMIWGNQILLFQNS